MLGQREQPAALVEHRVPAVADHAARADLGPVHRGEAQGLHRRDRDLADGWGHPSSIARVNSSCTSLLSPARDLTGAHR